MAGVGGANMEKFEEYFQMADLDRDGRISGAEAVAFLQRSNLPRQVLAQIWMHADQNRTGFLSRPEFYNALKLVTVVQSKRELTPEIVNAALYGPASSRIPPPQITTAGTPVPHPNSVAAPPLPQPGAMPQPIQNFGFRGPAPSSTSANQQFGALQSTMGIQSMPVVSSSGMNAHFGSALSSSGISQQFAQLRPSSAMNQQFGQVQPTNTSMNQQLGQLQPSSTGINQQFSQAPSSMNLNQNILPSQSNQPMRSPQSMPAGHVSHLPQATISPIISMGMAGPGLPNSSNKLAGGKSGVFSAGPAMQVLDRGAGLSGMPGAPNTQDQLSKFSSTAANDAMALVPSGNKSTLDPMFAGGLYSTNQPPSPQVSSAPQLAISLPTASVVTSVTSSPQPLPKPDPFEALQSTLMKPSTGTQVSPRPTLPNQQSPRQVNSAVQSGVGNSPPEQSQISWPKMTHPGIQKYAKVFMQVDSDRDGKITGDQARNLFFSWRLPREVLKQIWDLADQDSDSMLSLWEFCIALYLMERYREGHSLPPTLPNSVMFDETLLSLAGPPPSYGTMGWGPTTGFRPQQSFQSPQLVTPTGVRPPMQPMVPQPEAYMQFNQKNARGPVLDSYHVDKPNNEEANSLESKGLEAKNIDEKVGDTTNVILDSREKLEFYRTKMQDLVLYKSRCDSQLNEITERARADKTEAELLEKKYQEKYKQVAETHSKLMMEEASFREIQARKIELQQAIIKMEQGGSADGILQVRADRIQSDLDELLKALVDRCKKHSIVIVSSALIELPRGWQPGIPEGVALWDENWDKFEDEGFSFDIVVPETAGSRSDHKDNGSPTHSLSPDSLSNVTTFDKLYGVGASTFDAESVTNGTESRSPQGCPGRQTITQSSPQYYSDNHFRKSFDGDAEIRRSFDKPALGNFDNDDDIDSIWGFNAKDSDQAKHEEKYFFGSTDFGTSPDRRESPHADSTFQNTSPFTFEDSFPGSPLSRAGNSSRHSVDSKDHSFNNFSEYDSFDTHDMSSSSHLGNLTRFDSINSTRDFGHSSNFSFDDSDPFGSTGPFKASSETPERSSDSTNTF